MEHNADFVLSFPGSLKIRFRPMEQNFQKFFGTKSSITLVFLGLMPSSLVLFKGQTVFYKLFSK